MRFVPWSFTDSRDQISAIEIVLSWAPSHDIRAACLPGRWSAPLDPAEAAHLPADEKPLTAAIIRLAQQYSRYGYRRVTALLWNEGWVVNAKRVERIWRREGFKVPQKQPKRGILWLNDGSCVRLRPQYCGHVWSYDFVADCTHDGRAFRMLTVIDEHSRQCLAI